MKTPRLMSLDGPQHHNGALVYIPGYLTENADRPERYRKWVRAARESGWAGSVHLLWWDSSKWSHGFFNPVAFYHDWDKTKDRAKRTGEHHARRLIAELGASHVDIVGHSLGARVAFYTVSGDGPSVPLRNVVLLGGAVKRSKDWDQVTNRIGGTVANLHSENDPILGWFKRLEGRSPCGTKRIKYDRVWNIDVKKQVVEHRASAYRRTLSHVGDLLRG